MTRKGVGIAGLRKAPSIRGIACLLAAGQVVLSFPPPASAGRRESQSQPTQEEPALPKAEPPAVRVNRTVPSVTPPSGEWRLEDASEDEIRALRGLAEPLVPLGRRPDARENRALGQALTAFKGRGGDVAVLKDFLTAYPDSAWQASLLVNVGVVLRHRGFYSLALEAWRRAWDIAEADETLDGHATADAALGRLLELQGLIGQLEETEALLGEVEGRDVRGSAGEKVRRAQAGVHQMHHQMQLALPSIVVALERVQAVSNPQLEIDTRLRAFHPTRMGVNLAESQDLATSIGLQMRMGFRSNDKADIPLPAVIHLRLGHFSALVARDGDRYLLNDPILGDPVWMTPAALASEASGYFLIPSGPLPAGWRAVSVDEGQRAEGHCVQTAPNKNTPPAGPCWPEPLDCSSCQSGGMATYSFSQLLAGLHVADTPVGYSPPRGPAMRFVASYHQREPNQPQTFSYSNLGRLWTFGWLSFVEDDPASPSASAKVYLRGSGAEVFIGYDASSQSYASDPDSHAVLVRTSSSPIRYERRHADGSVDVFSLSDGAVVSPRRVFMTSFKDPQGNTVTLTWDGSFRIVAATDALGQVTTLSYEDAANPLRITKVTDPFGRFARFDYNGLGQLVRITDVIGIQSEFSYDTGDFIKALTTPYGTTTFTHGGSDYWVEAKDPLGGRERIHYLPFAPIPQSEPVAPTGVELYNLELANFNTFYWDKRAMALHPGEHTKALITHWRASSTPGPGNVYSILQVKSGEKRPLEGRVWYSYLGQTFAATEPQYVGLNHHSNAVARVLDDGSSQVYRYEYNSKGNVTRATDPVGRTTLYNYAPNEIDLIEVRQVNGQTTELAESRTYNSQRLPLTVTDAAGQTTSYTYKPDGRLETVVTPPRDGLTAAQRTTTYAYYSDTASPGAAQLQSVTAPNIGGSGGPVTTFTYDAYGRVRTATQSPDNYTTTTDFDALDRPTRVTYPDGTYEETVYNRLDVEKRRDRLGRWSHTFYDALRRVVSVRDAAGRTVTQEWCACGSLDRLINPRGSVTSWEYDVQGRVNKQTWPDGKLQSHVYETTTSRLKSVTDPKSQTIQYGYDLDDKLVSISYQNEVIATPDVTFSYRIGGQPTTGAPDIYGRLTQMADGTGTTTYTYHPVGTLGARRLKDVDGPLSGDTVSYTYDELGWVKTRAIGGGSAVTYAHDSLGRLTSQTNPLGTFTWVYDGVTARVLTLDYPNGQRTSHQYFDNLSDRQLKQIHNHIPATSTTISKFDYTYDKVGNILTWQQQTGAGSPNLYELGYDAADQLTTAILKTAGGSPTVLKRYGYAYDAAGNRTTDQVDDVATLGTYDTRDRLITQQPGGALLFKGSTNEAAVVTVQAKPASTAPDNTFAGAAQVPSGTSNVEVTATDPAGNVRTNTYQVSQSGATKSFAYDDNGNLTSDGMRTFEWDAEDRPVAVKQGGNTLASYAYDGTGRRQQKTTGSVARTYLYDGLELAEERLVSGGGVKYWHGRGVDKHLAVVDETGVAAFYASDHLGSVRQVTNISGSTVLARDYDPYGSHLAGGSSSGYAFTGREWDAESSAYYYRNRYYDPSLGRFLSEDPIGLAGDGHLFAYVANRPTGRVDPFGLKARLSDFLVNPYTCVQAQGQFVGFAMMVLSGGFNPGPGPGGSDGDKLGHCLAFCGVRKGCGPFWGGFVQPVVIGFGKELFDSFCYYVLRQEARIHGLPLPPCGSPWDPRDVRANFWGAAARDCESCADRCWFVLRAINRE